MIIHKITRNNVEQPVPVGLGDLVEKLAKPIARALRLPCYDKQGELQPKSGCAKRKARLNKIHL